MANLVGFFFATSFVLAGASVYPPIPPNPPSSPPLNANGKYLTPKAEIEPLVELTENEKNVLAGWSLKFSELFEVWHLWIIVD
jgi:hypothetical protein